MAVMRISPQEALAKISAEGFVYLDVRTPDEVSAGHPQNAFPSWPVCHGLVVG